MNKTLIAVIAGICLVLGGWAGFSLAPSAEQQTFQAAGDTASSAKIAQVVGDFSTTTPTTVGGACKLYNSDARDRIINAVTFDLNGVTTLYGATGGIATWNWKLATSTAADVYTAAGNNVLNTTVATSSPFVYVASTTPGVTGTPQFRIWASGTCLNLFLNGTSTAVTGNIRVDYSQGF